jgi:hypothetical protein
MNPQPTASTLRAFSGKLFLRLLSILIAGLCGLLGPGCQSTGKPVSARFASVEIRGNTPGQIRDVAIAVFKENGYKVSQVKPETMVFEKEGTKWNNFAYGDWGGDATVWIRVKTSIVPVAEGISRLQCHAYMIRDRGGATEEEIELSSFGSHPYQKLMDEVAGRFHSGNASAN